MGSFLKSRNTILCDKQQGFTARRSTETQLISTIHDIQVSQLINNRKTVDAAVLDFSTAFDKVPHNLLLIKLHHYGNTLNGYQLSHCGWASF